LFGGEEKKKTNIDKRKGEVKEERASNFLVEKGGGKITP